MAESLPDFCPFHEEGMKTAQDVFKGPHGPLISSYRLFICGCYWRVSGEHEEFGENYARVRKPIRIAGTQ